MILALLLAASAGAQALEMGLNDLAAQRLSRWLEHDDAPWVHARLGSALARSGRYADALAAFRFGEGSPFYEIEAYADHADALRALGRCEEAAALRLSARLTTPPAAEAGLVADAVEDLASCGLLPDAEALAWEGLAVDPEAPPLHAALAEVLLAAQRPADAEPHLALAMEDGGSPRGLVAVARARQHEEPELAELALARALLVAPRHTRAQALLLQLHVARGDWEGAGELLSRKPWTWHEDREILVLRARVHEALGDLDAAAEARERHESLYGPLPGDG